LNNLIIFLSVIIVLGFAPPVFAEIHDIVIFSEGRGYFIGEITEERKYRLSSITKVQGLTTTGEMFFIFTSSNFEKVMLLDRSGHWLKAELQENIIETVEPTIIEPTKEIYRPDLTMTSSHDFRTYWKDTFNIDVQAYDGNKNSNPELNPFQGRLDNVDVSVLLSLNDVKVATLSGVTQYGEWQGEYFFAENISEPGEYVVDIILSYLGKTVSKSSTFFVISTTSDSGSTNNDRDGDGILNVDDECPDDPDDFARIGESAGPPPPVGDGCPGP